MRNLLRWLFKEEWIRFENEMRQLELEHYLSHKYEIETLTKEKMFFAAIVREYRKNFPNFYHSIKPII